MDLTILLAVDDDPISLRAVATVARWLPPDATVVALHVGMSNGSPPGAWPAAVSGETMVGYPYATLATLPSGQELEEMAREVAGRATALADGAPVVEHGDPASIIRRVANDIRADLIVVGTSDRSWLSRVVRPSVGASVATDAPCSVLVVREPDYDPEGSG